MKKTCYILLVLTAVLTLCGCGIHKIDDPATAEKFTKAVEELGFTTEKETVDGGDVVTATYGKETAVVSYGQYDEMSSVTQMYDYFLKNASDNKRLYGRRRRRKELCWPYRAIICSDVQSVKIPLLQQQQRAMKEKTLLIKYLVN